MNAICHAPVSGKISAWSLGNLIGGEGNYFPLTMGRGCFCWPRGSKIFRLKHTDVPIPGFIVPPLTPEGSDFDIGDVLKLYI